MLCSPWQGEYERNAMGSKDKAITIHYDAGYRDFHSIDIILRENEWSRNTVQKYDVLVADETGALQNVDTLIRNPEHRTYQVHKRLRYDNKPRTRFRADKSGYTYRDTRNEALADVLAKTVDSKVYINTVHTPGRAPRWYNCPLCEGESE